MPFFIGGTRRALAYAGLWVVGCSVDHRELELREDPGATAGDDGTGAGSATLGGAGGGSSAVAGAGSTVASCGDGQLDGDEGCDDGATVDHDGCNSACEIEKGYDCVGEPSACQACVGEPAERRCAVAGGPFELGSDDERVPAALSAFRLDELEVTVGRFRRYVAAFAGPPQEGAAAHPEVAGSGWRGEWSASFPASRAALLEGLRCNATWETWTDAPGEREQYPLTCATYYVAFAFCASSGGRLPTEAEWEYAATGGTQERVYPWGDSHPSREHALYEALTLVPAGSHLPGRSRFGQLDLAGSVWEWSLDFYAPSYPAHCDRCAEVESGSQRVLRGGDWLGDAEFLAGSYRFFAEPAVPRGNVGFRCAYALTD